MSAYDDIWGAIGHLRGSKTKLGHTRNRHHSLTPAQVDLLTFAAQKIRAVELDLVAVSKLIQADIYTREDERRAKQKTEQAARAPRRRSAA